MAKRVPSTKTIPATTSKRVPTEAEEWLQIYREAEFYKNTATMEQACGELHKLGVFLSAPSGRDPERETATTVATAAPAKAEPVLQSASWLVAVSANSTCPLLANTLQKRKRLLGAKMIGGRLYYDVEKVIEWKPELRPAIEAALALEAEKAGKATTNEDEEGRTGNRRPRK